MKNDESTDWWWIDYLEDELTPELDQDLRLLLEHSAEDRKSFENLLALREWLKSCDPVAETALQSSCQRSRKAVMDELSRIYPLKLATKDLSV